MVYRRRRILLKEIERQCGIALTAYDEAAAALQRHNPDRFWYSLQGLTTAAGHLESLLWPAPNASIGWAAELRQALGMRDDSVLHRCGAAAVLNLAAALENWQSAHSGRAWYDSNYGPNGFNGAHSGDCLRYFDLENSVYLLCGHRFELPALLGAIAELGHRARLETEHLRELV
jgi:hypothetical protein